MSNVDKHFALLDRLTGDELFPYMKSQESTNRFGYALTQPGEKDRHGRGHYTNDIREVIQRVVFDGWKVRVKTINKIGKQRQGTMGIGKIANLDYWVSPEFLDMVKASPTQPQIELPSEKAKQLSSSSNITALRNPYKNSKDEESERPLDEDIDSASKGNYQIEEIQKRAIKTRRGQPDFRRRLFDAYDCMCAVTGCKVLSVLEAAHIIPHADETNYEVANGLPLRADIHTLFDLRLMAVSPDYRIHIAKELVDSEYRIFHGLTINFPKNSHDNPSPEKLAQLFESFAECNPSNEK